MDPEFAAPNLTDRTESSLSLQRMLLIGAGAAGSRFLRAGAVLQERGKVEVVGVCDRLSLADRPFGVPVFDDVDSAMLACRADLVVVAVTDTEHASVLARVLRSPQRPRVVACEKPLTTTPDDHRMVEDLARANGVVVTVNYLEECSPVVAQYLDWRRAAGARPSRVEFFWGKNRLGDLRPTIGALSEISHPLDLVRIVTGADPGCGLTDLRCRGVSSDVVPGRTVLDTISFDGWIDDCLVVGSCSFAWAQRDRRLIVHALDAEGAPTIAAFRFDDPVWDRDVLTIDRLANERRWERVVDRTIESSSRDAPDFQIAKLIEFLERSAHARGPVEFPLVGLEGSAWVQHVLGQLSDATCLSGPPPEVRYGGDATVRDAVTAADPLS
jgi:Oxidoreductase family, NAD-binding Rossmann fold